MKKYIITENQFKYLVENIINEQIQSKEEALKQFYKEKKMEDWFIKNILNKVEEKIKPGYPPIIDYIDKDTGKQYMFYNQENKLLWIGKIIWIYFEKNYSNDWLEIEKLMKEIGEKHMDLWDISVEYTTYW